MSEYAIETRSLSKRFGRKLALDALDLRIPYGGVHALIGSNGAGKSTLFRILLGLASPSAGHSRILGYDSVALPPEARGRIGLVHEEHTLPSWMTVRALVEMQRHHYPCWEQPTFDQVLGHFHVLPEQKVSQLSRGERAGLNLAMALAQRPALLILDEPTLGLDVVAKQAFLESLLFAVDHEDTTLVYCSHQMDEIERVAEHLIILEQGRLVSSSAPDEFLERIHYWVADFSAAPPEPRAIPGLLQAREIDGQQHLVVMDQDEDFHHFLSGIGGRNVQCVPVGFGRAVNAYLTRNHLAPSL